MTGDTTPTATADLALDVDAETGPAIDVSRLYRLWEAHNWSATTLDFTTDIFDWRERLTPELRRAIHATYSMFLHGEEAVARTLAPFVAAVPTQEQRIFLTTQIVDEARHHVLFDRFMREVIGDGHDVATTLEATRPELTTGFVKVFGELDRITDRLRRRPRDRALLAQCFALYHVVVEGMLAHPGQHMIRTYLTESGLLPGFLEGITHVTRDESRHMAFGVQVLGELIASSKANRVAVLHTLNRCLPWTMSLYVTPELGVNAVRPFGLELDELYAFGLRSLESKLARAGIASGDVSALVKVGAGELPAEEQARRALALLYAGVLGDSFPLALDDEVVALMFDGLQRVANMRPFPHLPGAIQWEFTDADPWYLISGGGRAYVRRGRATSAALTLTCTLADWARITGEKLDARRALLSGRLRTDGSRLLALRLPALLGA